MATGKRPWHQPEVKSIDDLSLAYGADCPNGSGPTGIGGLCKNGGKATNNCMTGTNPTGNCLSGSGVVK